MGIIERAFADISAVLGNRIIENQWVSADKLVHYNLHADLDIEHAEEFFSLIEPKWNANSKEYIIEGLEIGIYAFNQLYKELYLISSQA